MRIKNGYNDGDGEYAGAADQPKLKNFLTSVRQWIDDRPVAPYARANNQGTFVRPDSFYQNKFCPHDDDYHIIWNDQGDGNPGFVRLINRAIAAGAMLQVFKSVIAKMLSTFINNSKKEISCYLRENKDIFKDMS